MKNAGGFLIAAGLALLVGFGIYTAVNRKKGITNRVDADKIFMDKFGKTSNPSYGDDYVFAWATALRDGNASFSLGEKKYNTKTGKQTS